MFMSILAIGIVGLMGYVWLTRGFFSALIHLFCTVIAGAIAFGVWEPTSMFLLNWAPAGGFLSFIGGVAWGLGLAVPFAIAVAILRAIVDLSVRSNVNPGTHADYAGGAVCGALSGVIVSGIVVISVGFLRMEPTFLGATQVGYAQRGYVVRSGDGVGPLWVPVDRWTVALYGHLSETAFRTSNSLAQFHPRLDEMPASFRMNAFDGKSRNTTRPDDFAVDSRFTVGKGANVKVAKLLTDRWNSAPQTANDTNDQPYPEGSYIEGFVVTFKAGAKEKDGKLAVGAGQLWLVLENTNDTADRITVYPVACASQAESSQTAAARWRFDSSGTFISSVGGASEARFAFEFVVPPNYEPIALYVKGVRHLVSEGATATVKNAFRSTDERDSFLARVSGGSGAGGGSNAAGTLDLSKAVMVGNGQPLREGAQYTPEGFKMGAGTPFVLQDGTLQSLEISTEGTKEVIGGVEKLELTYEEKVRGIERSLRIERFATTPDTVTVQIDVGMNSRYSLLSPVAMEAPPTAPPLLWDDNNQTYEAIGYVYYDETMITISFKPGEPIREMNQLPTLSKSRPAQKLTLIYRVSQGAKIKAFAVGDKAIAQFNPLVPCDNTGGR